MPEYAYAQITGSVQGNISANALSANSVGGFADSNHTNEILVLASTYGVTTPVNPQTGQPTGRRMFKAATITKMFDQTSPLLWQSLCTGEVLSQILVNYYRTSTSGQPEIYFTVTWTNAVLTDGKASLPDVFDPKFRDYTTLETWAFTFDSVTYEQPLANSSGGSGTPA